MNNVKQVYPNNMWNPIEDVRPQSKQVRKGRVITTAMMKAISRHEAMKDGAPRFKCSGCQNIYRFQDARFCKDADHPFVAPTNVCVWCAHKKQTRWYPIK